MGRHRVGSEAARPGPGNDMVATASKLYVRGVAINIGLKLIGAPTDIRNRLPKDVRCAYSPDTDRCACLDPRGFKFPAELAQCKARALGEA